MKKTHLALAVGSGLALTSALALAFGGGAPAVGQSAGPVAWSNVTMTPAISSYTAIPLTISGTTTAGLVSFTPLSPPPVGAVYHQVVDRYFDAGGKVVEVQSKTHAVRGDCHPGRREQGSELIAQDDGKGNVVFADGATELGGAQDPRPLVRLEVEQRVSLVTAMKKDLPWSTLSLPAQLASVR